jgi:hypothetical protein
LLADSARPRWISAAVFASLLLVLGACFFAILPLSAGSALVAVFAWTLLPGVLVARRLYGSQRNAWIPALLVGPVWGFSLTSVALLGLWATGIRSGLVLASAPLAATLLAIPVGRLAGSLRVARFDRRDVASLVIVLSLVPIVNGLPYARVGEMRPEGKAYRAYFIADFVWAMAVANEVSKGDVPPRNPFLAGDRLHYYWLADLLSSIEHRSARRTLSIDQILLCNAMLLDLAFMAFFYFFVRQFVHSPPAAMVGCLAAVLFTSFEGAQQLYVFWQQGIPLDGMRTLNIDAISNWKFGSMKVDGLQRLLLYQPHHATAWAVSLSALLVVARAKDNARFGINLLGGTLLAVALLLSPFIALMVGTVAALYQIASLSIRRRPKALAAGALAGGVPVAAALLLSNTLQYVDRAGGRLVYVQVNPLAVKNATVGILLSFGPILIAAAVGAWLCVRRCASDFFVVSLIVAVSVFYYFFVDVVDHQHAYVGFRAGHLLFIAFAPLVGFAWQEAWASGRRTRVAAMLMAALLAVTAAPMTAIDLYNAQDTSNQMMGPGFRWTVILTPDELEALNWIKVYTPEDALVQVEPTTHDSETWAYVPAFAERRMSAGLPISMIPLKKYQLATQHIREVFAENDAAKEYAVASALKLQYLYIGPAERAKYPHLEERLDTVPQWFQPAFRNHSVSIYRVTPKG